MHRIKLFKERLAMSYKKVNTCNLRLVDGLYDDTEDRLPFLFAEVFEEATRCSRESLLKLIVRYAGHKRLKVSESLVCEDGATDRKTDCDAKELAQEHKGDAVCHVRHLDDTQNHSEAGLQIAAYASAQDDLRAIEVGVAGRGLDALEQDAADKDEDCSHDIPRLVKWVVWK